MWICLLQPQHTNPPSQGPHRVLYSQVLWRFLKRRRSRCLDTAFTTHAPPGIFSYRGFVWLKPRLINSLYVKIKTLVTYTHFENWGIWCLKWSKFSELIQTVSGRRRPQSYAPGPLHRALCTFPRYFSDIWLVLEIADFKGYASKYVYIGLFLCTFYNSSVAVEKVICFSVCMFLYYGW